MDRAEREEELLQHRIDLSFKYERLFRSQLIADAITLESGVDHIIARYFCPDQEKHPLFFSFVLREGEVTFSSKIAILKKLLKTAYPTYYDAFKFLPNRLDKLRELRNKLAHCEVVIPDSLEPPELVDGVTIRYYKDGKLSTERITAEMVDRQVNEARDLHLATVLLHIVISQSVAGTLADDLGETVISMGRHIGKRLSTA